ncbi:F-box/LRR-repeat protein 25-like [Camellia sinensis]|uniref:F-box/LRR-repeat protein 25-like n=1 Tax=Camellia sinensis TaxID=4442 RepID=UPI001036128D|nr:F-box/LRR-repeat protein 25-like [Camellia sinensis]
MEDSSNQKKKQAIEDGEEDRISTLPDPILHEILSSMDLKYAIQTCALSKRWRYLWTSLPNLHFDVDLFPLPNDSKRLHQFPHFVNQVLSQRDTNSNLCNFYFSPHACDHPSFIENSLSYAISHNVQQLHVAAFSYPSAYQLPLCLINSESLKSLTFEYGNQLNDFNITAPKLRNLELWYDDEHWFSDYYQLDSDGLDPVPDGQKIVVSAPRLTSFKLEGRVSPVFSATSLPCLDNVDIDIRVPFNAIIERSLSLNVINMLGQLREASSVTLSLITLEIL